jgi:hypothetical protein
MRGVGRTRAWWPRLLAVLVPALPDIEERLAGHYAAEERLAHGLGRDAEALTGYPHARSRVFGVAERARGRAQRVRRALEGLGDPAIVPATRCGPWEPRAWARLHASISELSRMSEECLGDAHAVERTHPSIARLLYDLHRETAGDRRDLIWTLAQLAGTEAKTSLPEVVA